MEEQKCRNIESILTEKHLKTIIHRLAGFLGDHFKIVVHLQNAGVTRKLHLFAKSMPLINKPKADFIADYNFFRRENLVYKLFENMCVTDSDNWCTKAYIHTDTLLVLPDLSILGYKTLPTDQFYDLKHVLIAVKSLAQFHAKYACYEANQQKSIYEDHREVLKDAAFMDAPWLRAAARLSCSLLREFSTETIDEDTLTNLFLKACDDLTVSKESINVILHRDLWTNNILFRHEGDEPKGAVLVDFQCVRYGPPAFDLMILLYLTTTKQFRESHEKEVFNHYYTVFTQYLDDTMKGKLKDYNYGRWDFFNWCERARMFAMMEAMAIFPFVLMDPSLAQKTFDDPDTFTKHVEEDRCKPVLDYARESSFYRERMVEVSVEFVDRYHLKRL
ncbi:uncharacterized protein LOC119838628 [Zerene cesonia]|uniref:uncharacterized protein LOC119838628 n=1 Tax=Zerene cesonia TaxID=33412 RepID=UPI0018E56A5E|nr:uncharacterized protein LOC119838628 [Zerene cesonia]